MNNTYDPHEIEPRWQRAWEQTALHHTDLDGVARPFYNLMEFPYPSSEGLHVGHSYSYGGADTYGRFQRMRGFDVFQPMGFDAFGIHSENYALRMGTNPAVLVPRNVERFRETQLKRMGAAFDWSREVNTSDPGYYRWTQWIFLQMLKGGLAYRAEAPVNWCPSCLTTLADEQVVEGRCERCDTPVTQRTLTQWFLRITAYAEQLLDFNGADFPATTQTLQRHWVGRKEGAEIVFPVTETAQKIAIFTTRPETIYGATFVVLAPEHPLVDAVTTDGQRAAVRAYVAQTRGRSELERLAGGQQKTGIWTGAWATNPVDGRRLPIWVADYVLVSFGTGAIFAVSAHDQRDFDFARAHDLPCIQVVAPEGEEWTVERAYEGDGTLLHSGPLDGLSVAEGRRTAVEHLQRLGAGRAAVTYRLRDWLISRQRYWGPPIPVVHCPHCGQVPVPEADLPVPLPQTDNFRPLGTGQSPLAAVPAFVHTTCPTCGGPAQRETDVSDNFLDSAWYFLRYLCTDCADRPWDTARLRKWLPVHSYIGGIEHSTMHHLYARFLWKALRDLGHIPRELGPEPFARLRLHGLIIKDGKRMSKSRGNMVNPDEYIQQHGADVLRVYMLFIGPFEEGGDFRDTGIGGITRFFGRVWRLASVRARGAECSAASLRRAMHQTIRDVTRDLETLQFNTAISTLMSYTNVLQDHASHQEQAAEAPDGSEMSVWDEAVRALLLMLAPLTPHLAEELWARRGGAFSIHQQPWPSWDQVLAAEESITLVVQVNGRARARLRASADINADQARTLALDSEVVRRYIVGRSVHEAVFVPGKLINLVLD
jgi:leucyl-tRNA synthetase